MAVIYTKDELGLINLCLMAIGEVELPSSTVPALIPIGTDASAASKVVAEVTLEVLSRGWWFNTNYYYELTLDIDSKIPVPTDALRIDFGTTVNRGRYIERGGFLYDLVNNTNVFTESVYADIIILPDYADLPTTAYQYIGLRAARKFQQRIIGAGELFDFTRVDEQDAYLSFQREQAQTQDNNLIDTRVVWRYNNPKWTNIRRKV